jgi:hypothetical protein
VSSIVVQKARATLALGEKALDQLRLLDLTRQYLRCERAEPSQALAIHAELSRRSAELRAAAAESIEPQFCDVTLQWLARAFELRKTETAAGALQSVEAIETALRAWLRRMNDLLTCAWGPQEVKQACELARSVGLAAGEAQLQFHNGTRLIGWRLDLQKPA